MLKPEQIPHAVIDAAVAMRDRGGSMSDIIRTAINAWPGAKMGSEDFYEDVAGMLCIPLTENNNAEV